MPSARYRIRFDGQVVEGVSSAQVRKNLQAIFKAPDERIERLFDGTARYLKKDLSEAQAEHYREQLKKAGALVFIEPMPDAEAAVAPSTPKPAQPPRHATSAAELSMVPIEGEDPESAESEGDAQAPQAAALSMADEQPTAGEASEAGGPARFEARPVGSTPIKRPIRKEPEPEDFREARFEFVGNGKEYFGIWIVNILLTIVTLGIYSAWATVRNNQYFYGNTRLDNASFQYLAEPITILKGRLIAFFAFVLYGFVSEMFPLAGIVLGICFIFAMPWIIIRSLRFRAVNSAYRNVRFDFQASYADALMVMVVWPFLNLLTLLLLTPFATLKNHRFIATGMRYGTSAFDFENTNGEYYGFFGKGLLIGIGFGVGSMVASSLIHPMLGMLVAMVGYLAVFGYFKAGLANLFLNSSTLKSHSFHSALEPKQLVWIYFSNSLLVLLTLGLGTPWAQVRMARYRAACTEMVVAGDLDGFVAAEGKRTSALGQELGDAFDVGIAAF
ncbi:DUF898 family protein [Marinobacter sp. JSM 1782161]|uniref:DUF898 family protein n=1 Tax=Marinobacter sp. JSM 1782161 TaxID=2685906 RepID=UPI0014024167|nr:DUF898 family protein [Marinobacter sp. JSM 1782161]